MLKRRVIRNTRKEVISFGLALLFILVVFFAVLNYFTSNTFRSNSEAVQGPLRFSLSMPQTTYPQGQAVPLQLTVTNISNADVVLRFDQDLEYDFVVKREVNLILATVPFDVWKYSPGHPGGEHPHQRLLRPGATLAYSAEWPQVDAEGKLVPQGRYVITGIINLTGAQRETLEIRGGTQ